MPEVSWYYARNDQQFGPVSPAELRRLAAARVISPEDLIWREGMEGWAPAARVRGLFTEQREPAAAGVIVSNGQTETMPPTEVEAITSGAGATSAAQPAAVSLEELLEVPTAVSADPRAAVHLGQFAAGGGWQVMDLLWLAQVLLWGICIGTVIIGGLLFTRAAVTASHDDQISAAAAVYGPFILAVYILARAGESVAVLLQIYFDRQRRR